MSINSARRDDTSMFRDHMRRRSKRKKMMEKCLFFAGCAVAIAVMLCVVFAYVIDK